MTNTAFKENMDSRPLSRYFKLSAEQRMVRKCRQKENYTRNRDTIRKRNYQRALEADKIRCPKAATLEKYDPDFVERGGRGDKIVE